jgi:hypothetical protein
VLGAEQQKRTVAGLTGAFFCKARNLLRRKGFFPGEFWIDRVGILTHENIMASHIRKSLMVPVVLAVLALVAPSVARADMEVTFQEDAGPVTKLTALSFAGISFNSTVGDFKIVFFGTTADDLTPTSDLMTSTTKITNTSGATHTLHINVTETDYTLPGGVGSTLDMTSHIGGTVTSGGTGQKLAFQSYASNSNLDFDTSGVTTGAQKPDISVTKSSFDSMPDPDAPFARSSGLYSVTATNDITLVGAGVINFSTSTTLTITPAPAGLLLALGAVPGLGIGAWLRRRGRKTLAC